MGSSIHGLIGQVLCKSLSNSGYELGCKLNGCVGSCTSNAWWGSWANYGQGCANDPGKATQTCSYQAEPRVPYCGSLLYIGEGCADGSMVFGGSIWSCYAGKTSPTGGPYCAPQQKNRKRGGINPAWADAVYGSNPFTTGHAWAYLTNEPTSSRP